MRNTFKHAFYLTLIVLGIGFFIAGITYYLIDNPSVIADPTPSSFFHIFIHNSLFVFIYAMPVLGVAYFIYSFTTIFIAMGLLFKTKGVLFTLLNLFHLPLELYAFCIVLIMGIHIEKKLILKVFILLLTAAFIEFYI